ncbi:LysE family transporter [uncultured Methylobacterium sp.]|jgi:threonine/homoserine/homoserine lactone efflux protein|uniref:LysE family translocator n=1 Tax=uncultured Methylobacterium sp. TaxID=157278 RepID=UPI002623EA31|nr:LysE family transporter [uncultured Methylobacterium sp.]
MPDPLPAFLAPLAASYALVLAVPGPNLLVVLRSSLSASTGRTVCTALGIGCGAALATALAAGCAALLPDGRVMQWAGTGLFACLLVRMALQILSEPDAGPGRAEAAGHGQGSFVPGLLAAASNPITVSFFAGYFLGHPGSGLGSGPAFACVTVFVMAAAWFSLVGIACTRFARRAVSLRTGPWLRRSLAAGLVGSAALALWRVALV